MQKGRYVSVPHGSRMSKVLVDKSFLWGLIHSDLLLQHLEDQGVDNWHGYYRPEDLEEQTNQLLKEIENGSQKENS
jgi:hypothetical protein